MVLADDGPLVLVETRKDLSQPGLPFERQATRTSAAAAVRRRLESAQPARPGWPAAARYAPGQTKRSSASRYALACIRFIPRPAGRWTAAAKWRLASLAFAELPAALRLRTSQAIEQLVDCGATVDRLIAQQHRVAAGPQRGDLRPRCGSSSRPSSRRAPAMLRSSLKTAPSKRNWRAQDVLQPARLRSPAGRASTFVYTTCAGITLARARRQPGIGRRIVAQQRLQAAAVDRNVDVAVGRHVAVTGKVLAAAGHAGTQQPVHHALGQQADDARIAVEARDRRSRCCRHDRGRAPV